LNHVMTSSLQLIIFVELFPSESFLKQVEIITLP
jgi:hypothetical protein